MEFNKWKADLERERKSKDLFFATHFQSPLTLENKSRFLGLVYFSPDHNYRFNLQLHEDKDREVLQIQDTTGNTREFLRWGEFRFKINNEKCTLQAYKSAPDEDRLFVPFKDATSGKETYGAGRYLDLNYKEDRAPEGMWILDFNRAYNPWCAYSANFSCPYVPPENWLMIPILAGEKSYTSIKMDGKE